MRLTLHFEVNRQRVTEGDVASLRRFQRELVSAVTSVALLRFAVTHDAVLARYLAAGDGSSFTIEPSENLDGWYRRDSKPWTPPQTLLPDVAARDICCLAHWDDWILRQPWPFKVHFLILQAHACTEAIPGDDVTIITRTALPAGVNELCHGTLQRLINLCWFSAEEPGADSAGGQGRVTQRLRDAIDLRFATGQIREGIERIVGLNVDRLHPITGEQDPDFLYEHDALDAEMFVRLVRADCDLDNDLHRSDADVSVDRW